ncbi:hypothetical protein EVAR_87181_1 [Eumeta japonica]|uniref:Uncharacterized protein n=1 Tax=Eumeta variegata TaxID=151549 RepID=A0A4C1VVQ1_EUMVA|nr:hypothetical protein EVAR_87181_1 [Eumeta japonica]
MSRRVAEAMRQREDMPTKRNAKAAIARSKSSVLPSTSGGATHVASGESVTQKELPTPSSNPRPRVAMIAGMDGIETLKQTETPEGAFVTVEAESIGTSKQGSCKGSTTMEELGEINHAATKIVSLARDTKDELEALRNISKEVKTSACNKPQFRRIPLPIYIGGGAGKGGASTGFGGGRMTAAESNV